MARRLLAVFLTAVLGLASGSAFALAGCTTNSFTTPSWLVESFASQTVDNLTVAAFHVLNRATNTSQQLRCSSSTNTTPALPGGWQSCSAPNRTTSDLPFIAAFQASRYTAYFFFNETWACNDAPTKPLNFTGIGNSSVAINCSTDQSAGTTCRSTKPLLVKGELLSPVTITPSYVGGPIGHSTNGCTVNSRTPAWEVAATQLNLKNVTGRIQGGNAYVIVTNEHLGFTASCGGPLTDAAAPQSLACQGQTTDQRLDRYQILTTLLFDPGTFGVAVSQTWFCDDQDPSQPFAITASGTTNLTLACQTFAGETTFCNGGPSGTFTGNVTSHALLPSYSLDDPLPTTNSCTVASMLSPAWWLDNFETNTTTDHSDVVTVRFGLELQTSDQPTGSAATVVADGVHYSNASSAGALPWYSCNFAVVADHALAPTNCSFQYDMASRFLGLRVQWQCADLDAHSPITFSGEMRTLLPELTCTTSGSSIRCAASNSKPWSANVTSFAWRQ